MGRGKATAVVRRGHTGGRQPRPNVKVHKAKSAVAHAAAAGRAATALANKGRRMPDVEEEEDDELAENGDEAGNSNSLEDADHRDADAPDREEEEEAEEDHASQGGAKTKRKRRTSKEVFKSV